MIPPRRYFRVMLGRKSIHAEACREGGFIGGDWNVGTDLTGKLPEDWREFNKKFIPVYLTNSPGKSKVAAGLACGMLYTICKGIQIGDRVLSPNGQGAYYVGGVSSDYYYVPGDILPHRRGVKWYANLIDRQEMSEALKNAGSLGTVSEISKHAEEIEKLRRYAA